MSGKISRRSFIKTGAAIGSASVLGGGVVTSIVDGISKPLLARENIDISVVTGENYFDNAVKAVEQLGGMSKFVSNGSKVGLLINSPWRMPGSFTSPVVVLAVLKMCLDAGAKEVISLESAQESYWARTELSKKYADEIKSIKVAGKNYKQVSIPGAFMLKEADVEKELLECDVYINVPVIKDHTGSKFTGVIKNTMGAASTPTCRRCHGKILRGDLYSDMEALWKSIVDLNRIRRPDLCVADATELILTNGPAGPGEITKPKTVAAGINAVSVDSYCAKFVKRTGPSIEMIKLAADLGMGEIDVSKLNVKELKL